MIFTFAPRLWDRLSPTVPGAFRYLSRRLPKIPPSLLRRPGWPGLIWACRVSRRTPILLPKWRRCEPRPEKAIELDPLSAESYDALGAADAREGPWERAEKNFRRSIEIQPSRPEAHGHFAVNYLLPLGRVEEAIQELRMAEKSDRNFTFFLGDALADAGR